MHLLIGKEAVSSQTCLLLRLIHFLVGIITYPLWILCCLYYQRVVSHSLFQLLFKAKVDFMLNLSQSNTESKAILKIPIQIVFFCEGKKSLLAPRQENNVQKWQTCFDISSFCNFAKRKRFSSSIFCH